jgi:alkylation response protein AidB-like acyl-CoA dehydrogenase
VSETIPDRDTQGVPDAPPTLSDLIQRAREIARDVLAPRANALDQGNDPPVEAVRMLANAGLLGLTTPVQFGGHGAPGAVVREYTETLASACGTTTFVQGQHLSACTLISGARNEDLKRRLLPEFASGRRIIGIAFAHVRRPGPPMLRVEETAEGYLFNGSAAWFTGWGVMTDVLIAGTLPDGRYLYAVAPLNRPGLSATPTMRLCAMNASGTVSLLCDNLLISKADQVKCITAEDMSATDAGAILGVTSQIFGVTRASISLVRELAEKRSNALLDRAADSAERELVAARAEVERWRDRTKEEGYKVNALAARARCIEMGVRAAHMAVTAGGGGANSRDHTAQRLFREAMFYTLTAQTRDVQTATLERLIASSETATRDEAG